MPGGRASWMMVLKMTWWTSRCWEYLFLELQEKIIQYSLLFPRLPSHALTRMKEVTMQTWRQVARYITHVATERITTWSSSADSVLMGQYLPSSSKPVGGGTWWTVYSQIVSTSHRQISENPVRYLLVMEDRHLLVSTRHQLAKPTQSIELLIKP